MTAREKITIIAMTIALLSVGALIGAAAVADHPIAAAPLIDDGALDFAADRPMNP